MAAVVAVASRADRKRRVAVDRASIAIGLLQLPPAVFKTCPWQPRHLIETGLRQWLRCCAAALHDDRVIGMPSHAVDEAWHGLILCTMRYHTFCSEAFGKYLHHNPAGGAPDNIAATADPMEEQLRRTVIAWSLVAEPGERCVLWDLDRTVGVEEPWGLDHNRVVEIDTAARKLRPTVER